MGQGRPTATASETLVPGHSPAYSSVLVWLRVAHATHVHFRWPTATCLCKQCGSAALYGAPGKGPHKRECSEQCAARVNTHEILARGGRGHHIHGRGWTVPSIPDNVWPELCRPDTSPGPRGGEGLGEDERHGDMGSEKTPRRCSLQL